MEEIVKLLPFFGLALIGAVMHIIKKIAKLEREERTFNPKKWWKKNRWTTVLGLLLSVTGVVILDDMGQLTAAACLLMGYTGDSLMKGKKDN